MILLGLCLYAWVFTRVLKFRTGHYLYLSLL